MTDTRVDHLDIFPVSSQDINLNTHQDVFDDDDGMEEDSLAALADIIPADELVESGDLLFCDEKKSETKRKKKVERVSVRRSARLNTRDPSITGSIFTETTETTTKAE